VRRTRWGRARGGRGGARSGDGMAVRATVGRARGRAGWETTFLRARGRRCARSSVEAVRAERRKGDGAVTTAETRGCGNGNGNANANANANARGSGRTARGRDETRGARACARAMTRDTVTSALTGAHEMSLDVARAAEAAEAAEARGRARGATLRCGDARLDVREDGRVTLRRGDVVVCEATCALPAMAMATEGTVTRDEDGGARVTWGSWASLVVRPSAVKRGETWCDGLSDGFVLDFSVADAGLMHSTAEICVDLERVGDVYGGSHLMAQHWPLNDGCMEIGPHYPFDNGPNGLNTLVANHWVTSKGVAVVADPDTPYFHVGLNAPTATMIDMFLSKRAFGVGIQNATRTILPFHKGRRKGDGLLRLQARNSFHQGYGPFSMNHPLVGWVSPKHADAKRRHMRVALCANKNVKMATMNVLKTLQKPKGAPPADVFRAPIWTTWAKMKTNVSQEKVLNFAREIVDNGMSASVIEIDDKWQSGYGDLEFDSKKFPDPSAMVDHLHSMGFKVTVWVMPFIAEDTDAYREGKGKGYFVESSIQNGFFRWWQSPPVVALDVTNPEAVDWFVSRLRRLQSKHGIDGFKFDAGEPCFLPRRFVTHTPLSHPSEYTRAWVNNVASQFELAEVRSGHNSTGNASLVRMGDRFSDWGVENGLGSIIPALLTSGVLGYPFCLPDIIGGNAYFGKHPDEELLVRWAQANALMPAMQFSLTPWASGSLAKELCASALEKRDEFIESLIHHSERAVETLEPICRPLWWLDPEDSETFRIGDQFAIGDDVIVAPVVCRGANERAIYLTEGCWRDLTNGKIHQGKQWMHEFEAPLGTLPVFVRTEEE